MAKALLLGSKTRSIRIVSDDLNKRVKMSIYIRSVFCEILPLPQIRHKYF